MAKLSALALFIVLLVAAPAHAWTNPLLMSFPDESWSDHAVGIDGAGNSFVVMRNANDGIWLNSRTADEQTGKPVQVNAGHGQQPKIATNAAGTSAIAWIGTDGPDAFVHLRLRRPTGSYTTDTVISPAGADATRPEVGIDDAGNAFVSWQSTDGVDTRTYLRVRDARGQMHSLQAISPATGASSDPHLAVEPGGQAFVTYVRNATIYGRARATSGTLSTSANCTSGPDTIFDQAVSIDSAGDAIVAWSSGNANDQVRVRRRSAAGTLSGISTVSPGGTDVVTDEVQALPGAVGWVRYAPGDRATLQLRRIVGGQWQPIQNMTPAGITPANVSSAAGGGRIVFAFTSFEDGGATQRLRTRERRPDGSLSPLSILSAENGNGGGPPRLAVNGSGQAAASWLARLDPNGFALVWVGTNFLL